MLCGCLAMKHETVQRHGREDQRTRETVSGFRGGVGGQRAEERSRSTAAGEPGKKPAVSPLERLRKPCRRVESEPCSHSVACYKRCLRPKKMPREKVLASLFCDVSCAVLFLWWFADNFFSLFCGESFSFRPQGLSVTRGFCAERCSTLAEGGGCRARATHARRQSQTCIEEKTFLWRVERGKFLRKALGQRYERVLRRGLHAVAGFRFFASQGAVDGEPKSVAQAASDAPPSLP